MSNCGRNCLNSKASFSSVAIGYPDSKGFEEASSKTAIRVPMGSVS